MRAVVSPGSEERCRLGAAQQPFQPQLSAARRAIAERRQLTIVALGSSTTAGGAASSPTRSYPAVLEGELRRRLPPQIGVRVVNKGIGGQSAYDMLQRMDEDVVAEKPSILIWQTVVTDAIRDIGEAKLGKILQRGIGKARGAGIDVVLMDLQWLPRVDRYPQYDSYRTVLRETAAAGGAAVFPRYAMMRSWAQSKRFTQEELFGVDGLGMVDASYHCMAMRLADGIVSGLSFDGGQSGMRPGRGGR